MNPAGLKLVAALVLWPALVAPGYVMLERYSSTPSRLADPPATWPSTLPLRRDPSRATLVFLAHPRCPCTRASLAELARLMPLIAERSSVYVLFLDPAGAQWRGTDIWALAEAIPGVDVRVDPGGQISEALGVYTSGQVLLYDQDGDIVFNGGITPGRGHEGNNAGSQALAAILSGHPQPPKANPVFGCDLHNPERAR